MPATNGLHYDSRGEGESVLFIQGAGVPGGAWSPQIDALSSRFRCIWFDNRGIGKSERPNGPLDMVADARAVLDALSLERAHLVGHSLGGLVAQQMADRAESLSLLCSFARGREASSPSAAMIWIGLRTYVGTRRMRRHAFLEIVLAASKRSSLDLDAEAERFGRLFERDLADPAPIAMTQLRAASAYDASGLDLPSLVVSGAEDVLARPEYGRSLADRIPHCVFHTIEGAAHGATITHAEEVNRLLLDHVSNATARSSGVSGRAPRGEALS